MIKMVSEDGQLHEYRSVDELPPEEQAAIEQLKSKAVSVAPGLRTTKVTLFKVKDAQGNERIYHSLDELLPEVRAEIEKLESEALNESPTSAPANAPASLTVVKKNVSLFKVRDAQGNERIYHSLDELPPEIREAVKRAQNKTD
jgi:uncharacterized protein YrzB (UPF0473 family)